MRSTRDKVIAFFVAISTLTIVLFTVIYYNIQLLEKNRTLISLTEECRTHLKEFIYHSNQVDQDESEYKRKIQPDFHRFSTAFKRFITSSSTATTFEELDSLFKVNGKTIESDLLNENEISEDQLMVVNLWNTWATMEENTTLILEEQLYIQKTISEIVALDEVVYDSTAGFVTSYIKRTPTTELNPNFISYLSYNDMKAALFFDTLQGLKEYYTSKAKSIDKKLSSWIGWFLILLLLALLLSVVYIYFILIKPLKKTSANATAALTGDSIVSDQISKSEEFEHINKSLYLLNERIKNATLFVEEISKGNLEREIEFINTDHDEMKHELANALLNMRNKMIEVRRRENERSWEVEGLAMFTEQMQRNSENFTQLCNTIVAETVKYLDANQGGLFVVNNDDDTQPYLELTASFAYDRKKFISKRLEMGEGLVGQAWQEKGIIHIKDLPENHMVIKSGLGDAGPTSLLIAPLVDNGEVFGILELASFNNFEDHQISFVEKLSSSIASFMSAATMTKRTKNLLSNSQELTERLMAQDENMRQSLKEMRSIQEKRDREIEEKEKNWSNKSAELAAQLTALEKNQKDYLDKIEELENMLRIKEIKINQLTHKKDK